VRRARWLYIARGGCTVDREQRHGAPVQALAIGQHGRRRSVSARAKVRRQNIERERARERVRGHCPEGVRRKASSWLRSLALCELTLVLASADWSRYTRARW
jgi:hypothetical protein